jgi:1,4-alpha-glucan branching enzyme
MENNNLVLVLHTHLPYVLTHGYEPHGEAWLYEVASECYLPLINMINELAEEEIAAKVTFDISPVLCEQLASDKFKSGFISYCTKKIEGAEEDKEKFRKEDKPHFEYLAGFWKDFYSARLNEFKVKYENDIVMQFKKLQDKGYIEMMTCGLTHGYLPLLGLDESVEFQIESAVENYKKHFGRKPTGIWLPECAYRPAYDWHTYFDIDKLKIPHPRKGEEHFLQKHNINYFISDEKFIRELKPLGKYYGEEKSDFVSISSENFKHTSWNFHNDPMNIYEVSSEFHVHEGSAAVFARHKALSMLVWSGKTGYPGEGDYLEFHKQEHPHRHKYWRITDSDFDLGMKEPYNPDWIEDKLDKQSNHFIHNIENSVNFFQNHTGKNATITLAFDTELFGHWWFEGPQFLKYLIKGLANSPWVNMVTCNEAYKDSQPKEVIAIPEGSWGKDNNHDVWINEGNKWTWEKLYYAELRFSNLMATLNLKKIKKTYRRILEQALRELLLAQSSDWQFLIETGQARDYADHRFHSHITDFNKLLDIYDRLVIEGKWQLKKNEKQLLEICEQRDSIFEEIRLELWRQN